MAPVGIYDHVCLPKPPCRDPVVQTKLAWTSTSFTYRRPPKPAAHHTPAPNRIRRTTHTPFFSTRDRTLTSILRLPTEIRLEIYRLLLLHTGTIRYSICRNTSRLIFAIGREQSRYPYYRHGLFPAILSCCRTTRNEGAQVLYGENQFEMGTCNPYTFANSWALTSRCRHLITRLNIGGYYDANCNLAGWTLADFRAAFPAARRIAVHLIVEPEGRGSFLDWATGEDVAAFKCIKVDIDFRLDYSERKELLGEPELGLKLCQRTVEARRALWGDRMVCLKLCSGSTTKFSILRLVVE